MLYADRPFCTTCASFIHTYLFPLLPNKSEIEACRSMNRAPVPHLKVQRMLKVMDEVEAPMLPTFNYHFSELSRLYIEAKDNVK